MVIKNSLQWHESLAFICFVDFLSLRDSKTLSDLLSVGSTVRVSNSTGTKENGSWLKAGGQVEENKLCSSAERIQRRRTFFYNGNPLKAFGAAGFVTQ